MDLQVTTVIDRNKVADSIHQILTTGIGLLKKQNLEAADFAKIKVIRTLGSHVNAAVIMVQQETAQQRIAVVLERMKQLGYEAPPALNK